MYFQGVRKKPIFPSVSMSVISLYDDTCEEGSYLRLIYFCITQL